MTEGTLHILLEHMARGRWRCVLLGEFPFPARFGSSCDGHSSSSALYFCHHISYMRNSFSSVTCLTACSTS